MEVLSELVDSSFKYILLAFNLVTLIVVYLHKQRIKVKKQHHILFVFAHPDDEAMFFGPTLNSLSNQYFIHFLCLSNGNTIRAEQLSKSAQYFGIHKFQCIHHQNMVDGMNVKWSEDTIVEKVREYVKNNNIRAIFTFDQHGISGHINHRYIHYALSKLEVEDKQQKSNNKTQKSPPLEQKQTLLQQQKEQKKEQQNSNNQNREIQQNNQQIQNKPIKIYYLQTTNIIRKYTGILQLLIVPFKQFSFARLNYFHGYNSMALHKSQFVWYRKLFVLFSRYTYVNTFQMKKIKLQ